MPGPSKKPEIVKSLRGSSRNDRKADTVPLESVDALPAPPDWLPNAFAVREWDRLGPILVNFGLLTESGLSALAHLCALHGRIVQLWTAGMAPTGHLYSQYSVMRRLRHDSCGLSEGLEQWSEANRQQVCQQRQAVSGSWLAFGHADAPRHAVPPPSLCYSLPI